MKILFLSSEVVPYSKTGGLADVAGALPAALAEIGHELLVATPRYGHIQPPDGLEALDPPLTLRFPFGPQAAHYALHGRAPNLRVLFIGNDAFFARPGIYNDPSGSDFPDNHRRFAFFTLAALSGAQHLGFVPDIVHFNDWQTGLGPLALRRGYAGTALARAKSVFTIHNLAYQGLFPKRVMEDLGLPWDVFTPEGLEFYDHVNFLKAGLVWADALTTVSPRYAQEIQTPEAGYGLDGLLRRRTGDLHGILNGIDAREWNPAEDPYLPARYDQDALDGKATCRRELLSRFGLTTTDGPVFGIVSRLAGQKGFDILIPALEHALGEDIRLVVLGSGEARYEAGFRALQQHHPDKVGLRFGFDVALSHLVEAGADFFLMPSLYEPCGLNQLYSLRYGTVPVVRAVGGLDDTVVDVDADLAHGTGIKFGPYDAGAAAHAIGRALELWRDPPRLRAVRRRGMHQDFSWTRSARAYEALYRSLVRPESAAGQQLPAARKAQ
ncbi:MAG: glycogen synthase GlgA [Myxococcaceae bacterium]|nr:glycogen synthase GlgA [Myxococcaceae bacterium]